MKAAVYYENGGPEVLRYEDMPDPVCAADGILVRVEAISIEGADALRRRVGRLPNVPHIPGYLCAGTVIEVGPQVSDREVGQKVVAQMMHGSHAELVAVPATSSFLIPEGLDPKVAACVPITFGTAYSTLFHFGKLQPGETVLVQGGAGGVGLASIQLARRAGATVLATASKAAKVERLAAEFGVARAINSSTEDVIAAVKEATGGRGVDMVVETIGYTAPQSVECLARHGRVMFVGNLGPGDVNVDVSRLFFKALTIMGAPSAAPDGVDMHAVAADLMEQVARGELTVVIDRTYPLAEAAEAHAYIESRVPFGRVVLIP